VGLFSPLPRPQTARPSGCKGARNARKLATNPCSATGASGSHLRSFASLAKWDKAGANIKCRREAGVIDGPSNPDICTSFPLSKGRVRFPVDRSDRNYLALRPVGKEGWRREELKANHALRRIASRGSWR
jgi:hypothetical protein